MAYQSIPGTEDDETELCGYNCRKSRKMSVKAEYSTKYKRKNKEKIDMYRKENAEKRREYMRQYRQRKKQSNETLQD